MDDAVSGIVVHIIRLVDRKSWREPEVVLRGPYCHGIGESCGGGGGGGGGVFAIGRNLKHCL